MFKQKNENGKKYFQKNSWILGSPAGRKIWETNFFYLFIAPPKKKHRGTALERWMKPDPPLWERDTTVPLLLLCYRQMHMTQLH